MKDRLRKEARDQPCMLRLPGVCTFDSSTTVLAHIRRGGTAGMGMKPPDVCGVHACSACHDLLDSRNQLGGYTADDIDGFTLDALCRQLAYWVKKGSVVIKP